MNKHRYIAFIVMFLHVCRSVSYYPCGLCAPLLPYKSRPVGFWREALKLLMHSLGLSLVREGAVCIRVCIIYTCVCVIYGDRYVVYRV